MSSGVRDGVEMTPSPEPLNGAEIPTDDATNIKTRSIPGWARRLQRNARVAWNSLRSSNNNLVENSARSKKRERMERTDS